jgi:O-antigen ligase
MVSTARGDSMAVEGWGGGASSGAWPWVAAAGLLLVVGLAGFLVHPVLGLAVVGLLAAPLFVTAPQYGLLLFVAILPFDALLLSQESAVSPTRLLAMVLLGGWIVHLIVEGRRVRLARGAWLLAAYVAFAAVSVGWAANTEVAVSALTTLTQLFLLSVMASNVLRQPRDVRRLLDVLLISTAALATVLLVTGMGTGGRRITFSFGGAPINPNYLSAILVYPAVAAVGLGVGRGLAGWWRLAAAAPIMLTVVLSGSRGGGIALAGGLAVVAFLRPRVGLWAAAGAVGLVLLLPLVVPKSNVDRLYERYAAAEQDRLSGRMDIWRVALAMVEDSPLTGTAIGGFKDAFYQYMLTAPIDPYFARIHSRGNRAAHNIYIGTLAELGLVGFALLTAALLAHARGLWRARRAARRAADDGTVRLTVAMLGVFGSLLLFGSTIDLLATKVPWILLAAMQAVVLLAPPGGRARRA